MIGIFLGKTPNGHKILSTNQMKMFPGIMDLLVFVIVPFAVTSSGSFQTPFPSPNSNTSSYSSLHRRWMRSIHTSIEGCIKKRNSQDNLLPPDVIIQASQITLIDWYQLATLYTLELGADPNLALLLILV